MGKHSNSLEKKVFRRISGGGIGCVFTPNRLKDLGPQAVVAMALSRLVNAGKIRKLARGLYDYPRKHPDFGLMAPSDDAIATAIRSSDDSRLQIAGAHAANLLGLSNQVPVKVVYLTDGRSRKVKIGNREIILKKTTPRQMATAGKVSGIVIQALRWIRRSHVDDTVISKLKNRLSDKDRKQLIKDICHAPEWIADIFRKIRGSDKDKTA